MLKSINDVRCENAAIFWIGYHVNTFLNIIEQIAFMLSLKEKTLYKFIDKCHTNI